MSILDGPRINFRGGISVNPCTANNDDVLNLIDPVAMRLRQPLSVMNDDDAGQFLRSVEIARGNPTAAGEDGPQVAFLKSGWNLYGDHAILFRDVSVRSVVAADGTTRGPEGVATTSVRVLPSAGDAHGASVLVDVDCSGLVTTQFWIGGFSIDGPTGPILRSMLDCRGFQRRLSFARTAGPIVGEQNFMNFGCIVQFSMKRAAVVIPNPNDPIVADLVAALWPDDPGAAALDADDPRKTASRGARGISVRFTMYQAEPDLDGMDLAKRFALGEAAENPAYAYLVGTVGVWRDGEIESEVPGRLLRAGGDTLMAFGLGNVSWRDRNGPRAPLAGYLPGNAVATVREDVDVVSIDMCNAVSNDSYRNDPNRQGPQGFDYPECLASFGDLRLVATLPGGVDYVVGSIPYGGGDLAKSAAALDRGLVFDLPFPAALRQALLVSPLRIATAKNDAVNPDRVFGAECTDRIETDFRGVYMKLGAENGMLVRVTRRDAPVTSEVELYLTMFQNVITMRGNNERPDQTIARITDLDAWRWQPGAPGGKLGGLYPMARITALDGGKYLATGTPNEQGWLYVPMKAKACGAGMVAISTKTTFGTDPTLSPINPAWGSAYYACFHVFYDDAIDGGLERYYRDGKLDFKDVYEVVLRYYAVLFPAMSTHIDLADEGSITQAARSILKRTEPAAFFSTHYMPVTRALPPARRKMLRDYCHQVLGEPPDPADLPDPLDET